MGTKGKCRLSRHLPRTQQCGSPSESSGNPHKGGIKQKGEGATSAGRVESDNISARSSPISLLAVILREENRSEKLRMMWFRKFYTGGSHCRGPGSTLVLAARGETPAERWMFSSQSVFRRDLNDLSV